MNINNKKSGILEVKGKLKIKKEIKDNLFEEENKKEYKNLLIVNNYKYLGINLNINFSQLNT